MKKILSAVISFCFTVSLFTMCFSFGTSAENPYDENVVSGMEAILDYFDIDGLYGFDSVRTLLDAYKAAPTEENKNAMENGFSDMFCLGYDRNKIFITSTLSGLFSEYEANNGFDLIYQETGGKKAVEKLYEDGMNHTPDEEYVDGIGPKAFYRRGDNSELDLKNGPYGFYAMDSAETAGKALDIWTEALRICNENTKLIKYAELEAVLAEAKELRKKPADKVSEEDFDYAISFAETTLRNVAPSGMSAIDADGEYRWYLYIEKANSALKASADYLSSVVSEYAEAVENMPETVITELTFCPDGNIRVLDSDGAALYAGLVKDSDGNIYYINSTKKAVKNCEYEIGEAKANNILPAGTYIFGTDGKLIANPAVPEGTLKIDADGKTRYYDYENNALYAGLVKDSDGNIYYINSTKTAVKNCEYSIGAVKTNGIMPAGTYNFDSDGKMILKSGLVKEKNGDVRWYENGIPVYKGLVKDSDGSFYYINSTKKAVRSVPDYEIGEAKMNGITEILPGHYGFDENGKLIIK